MSLNTLILLKQSLLEKIQIGLTLSDIESSLFFILVIRFLILTIRYNLKSSFYITCIGLFAGYLWYRHLIDLVAMYRGILVKVPFLHRLGMEAIELRALSRQSVFNDLKLGDNTHWYNPGQTIYYAFIRGITHIDSETGFRYYIDPISMLISKLQDSSKQNIEPLYYKLYNKIIPRIYSIFNQFWAQLSGIAAYAVITRIGKRYCPYLIRWHWTFLLIIGLIEQILVYFIYRVFYFQTYVLIPQAEMPNNMLDSNLVLQINLLNGIIGLVVLMHIGFIIFGLFHAIWGQYFYFPFFVENTELHIGFRPKTSIYSGGQTAWQDSDEKTRNFNRLVPRLWYGWFGTGTNSHFHFFKQFRDLKIIKKFIKNIKHYFTN